MFLRIFNVEHGASALLITSTGRRIMIDCGKNSSTGWKPGTFLAQNGISFLDYLVVTNYDEDHVSGYQNLIENVHVNTLCRNPSISSGALRALKAEGGIGNGMELLIESVSSIFVGGPPSVPIDFGDTHIRLYWNRFAPKPIGFCDTNNLSLVTFVQCGHHKLIFPGDMEKAGWQQLLKDPNFVNELFGVTVFVTSHHGRENGYCEDVLKLCPNIRIFIVSDGGIAYQSQDTVDRYRAFASGVLTSSGTRRVLTTRRDSDLSFNFPQYDWGSWL